MANPIAIFKTSMGTFRAEIYLEQMPITANNFLGLARSGFYDGLHFHRVVHEFMVQFGCPNSRDPRNPRAGTGGAPHGTIKDEFLKRWKLSNEAGTLAMANNGEPDSGSSQFFINTAHNKQLDWFRWFGRSGKHPVFGKVLEGMNVVNEIAGVAVDGMDRPQAPVQVEKVTIEE